MSVRIGPVVPTPSVPYAGDGRKVSHFNIAAQILFQFHPLLPSCFSQASSSNLEVLSHVIRLSAELPPRTLPRFCAKTRLLALGCAMVVKFQSYLPPSVEPFLPGTEIPGSWRPSGPASMTRTLRSGRPRLMREATARPAVPPPMTILSLVRSSLELKCGLQVSESNVQNRRS